MIQTKSSSNPPWWLGSMYHCQYSFILKTVKMHWYRLSGRIACVNTHIKFTLGFSMRMILTNSLVMM